MDTNKAGFSVPNDMCVLCQEATEDVSYDEHVRHVDFIALTSRAAGYHTPSPPPDEWKRRYDLLRK